MYRNNYNYVIVLGSICAHDKLLMMLNTSLIVILDWEVPAMRV